MHREPLQVSLLGGSVGGGDATLVLRALHEAATGSPPSLPSLDCICPDLDPLPLGFGGLDFRSLGIGVCIGFLASLFGLFTDN